MKNRAAIGIARRTSLCRYAIGAITLILLCCTASAAEGDARPSEVSFLIDAPQLVLPTPGAMSRPVPQETNASASATVAAPVPPGAIAGLITLAAVLLSFGTLRRSRRLLA